MKNHKHFIIILSLFLSLIQLNLFAADRPMLSHLLTTTDGEKISYTVGGNDHGTPVVLIHGFPFSSSMWESQVEVLKKDFHVITYDMRGAGKSQAMRGPFTMEMLVDDFTQLLDKEKISKAIVVGFSMGGFLALRAIERSPERFQALVLADTKSGADSNESKLKRNDAIKIVRSDGVPAYADIFLKQAVAPTTMEHKPELLQKIKYLVTTSNSGIVEALFALLSRTDTTAVLPHIKVPTLILVGDSDAVTPLTAAQALHEGILGSQLQIVSQAGHMSPVENPEMFNAYLLKFIKSLP